MTDGKRTVRPKSTWTTETDTDEPTTERHDRGHRDVPDGELADAIDALEAVDWRRVPTVSPLTAAVFCDALDAAREGDDVR